MKPPNAHLGPVSRAARWKARIRGGGFTLIELLIMLALVTIIGSLATGSLGRLGHALRLRTLTEDFLGSLRLARSEALKRNVRVTLCKSASGESCTQEGGWHQGWILFEDADNDAKVGPGEPVIRRVQALPADWRLTGNDLVERYISYAPNGRTRTITNAFQAGTVTLCRVGGDAAARLVVINNSGRVRAAAAEIDACT